MENDTTTQTAHNLEEANTDVLPMNQESHISKNSMILPPSYEASLNDPTI